MLTGSVAFPGGGGAVQSSTRGRQSVHVRYVFNMSSIYTKNGRPVQVSGDKVFSRSGQYVGRLKRDRLYAPDGRYLATLDGDRLIYRSTHSASMGGAHAPSANRGGSGAANSAGSGKWGDEPDIPD